MLVVVSANLACGAISHHYEASFRMRPHAGGALSSLGLGACGDPDFEMAVRSITTEARECKANEACLCRVATAENSAQRIGFKSYDGKVNV